MKALLVENIHPDAEAALSRYGAVEVERLDRAVEPGELIERLKGVNLLGIRSRTRLTADVFASAPDLIAAGCFCIGTNQVDLEAAAKAGVYVFNAPFANTRSVAELTLASVIMLMRGIPAKTAAAHRGEWHKSAAGAHEVRGKKLGIVGYGNIGSQLSVLASGLGMHVHYFDIEPKLAHGNARAMASLGDLLEICDAVTLHVPSTDQTRGLIGSAEIARMKPGAILINQARGDLVDVDALAAALKSGHLAGAAVDVFPKEPASKSEEFLSPLRGLDNALLTPHIGGSTEEAQAAIGEDAGLKLSRYAFEGATAKAVNLPELEPGALVSGRTRLTSLHTNAPGYLSRLNELVGGAGLNIAAQYLNTSGSYGYASADLEGNIPAGFSEKVAALGGTIRARLLTI
ncbi:phosphoglycerate dehydrogenase [Hyphobacterium marinum]|uniref:Phosphoglycerate dehydrogenase n=1 Tax=Hyphobacterium marinum TaxID=3116574 RepID=A0ABU7LU99_9PROT|nr:phosphoglycerate dehydrogenase [Hyphobacterium sp. Y6023]MEE2565138.1 phosphoglycerate dehydrogenase [Hyphobacterium sp. Y6023]